MDTNVTGDYTKDAANRQRFFMLKSKLKSIHFSTTITISNINTKLKSKLNAALKQRYFITTFIVVMLGMVIFFSCDLQYKVEEKDGYITCNHNYS